MNRFFRAAFPTLATTVICLFCSFSLSGYDFKKDGFYYDFISEDDRTVALTNDSEDNHVYNPSYHYKGDVTIPQKVIYNHVTYDVVGIDAYAFFGCVELSSVKIPNTIKSIGIRAFNYCESLKSVDLPKDLKLLASYVFSGCKSLKSVDLPNGLTIEHHAFMGSGLKSVKIPSGLLNGESAFAGCENLTDVTFPDGFKKIPDYFFSSCTSLKSITIPETVTSIGNSSFFGSGLQSVTIPENVDYLGYGSFSRCEELETVTFLTRSFPDGLIGEAFEGSDNLKSIVVNDDNPDFKVVDGALLSKDGTLFIFYPTGLGREEYSIPEGVTYIYPSAFTSRSDGNPSPIKKLHFPQSLSSIDPYGLIGISGKSYASLLSEISVANPKPPVVEQYDEYPVNMFADYVYGNATLYVPVGSADAYKNAADWKLFAKIEEKEFSGVADVDADGIKVAVQGGNIVVSGFGNGKVAVYRIDGRLIYEGTDSVVPVAQSGIYIVKAAGTTTKVIL